MKQNSLTYLDHAYDHFISGPTKSKQKHFNVLNVSMNIDLDFHKLILGTFVTLTFIIMYLKTLFTNPYEPNVHCAYFE